MPNSPTAIVDALESLHEAEQGSVFRLLGDDSPFVTSAPEDVRAPLRRLHDVNRRHSHELAGAIRRLGGTPRARAAREPSGEESYLKFLSLRFLVPKLLHEKELMLERYNNALRALPKTAPADIADLLRQQVAEQSANVDDLQATAARVSSPAGSKSA